MGKSQLSWILLVSLLTTLLSVQLPSHEAFVFLGPWHRLFSGQKGPRFSFSPAEKQRAYNSMCKQTGEDENRDFLVCSSLYASLAFTVSK